MASILTPPVSSYTMGYPDYGSMLANSFKVLDNSSFPAVSALKTQQRFDSDNNTFVPSASTVLIYPKTALQVEDTVYSQINGRPFGDNASLDAFGKLRTSSPVTLFDSKFLYGKTPQIWTELVSGGYSVWDSLNSNIVMSTSAIGEYVIRQTPVHFNYQPGKSLEFYITGLFAPEAGIIKRVGAFHGLSAAPYDVRDGIYLEVRETGAYLCVAKTNGSTTVLTVPQSAWNVDKLDGTGPSGIAINFTKGQTLVIDYAWGFSSRIRFGFVLNGVTYYCHYATFANSLTQPYMRSPNQPIRFEIRQTGGTSGSLTQTSASVLAEGGENDVGSSITVELSAAQSVTTDYTPVLAIRINPSYHDIVSKLQTFDILNTGNSDLQYKIVFDPTVTSGSYTWLQVGTSGTAPLQYAYTTGVAVSGGFSVYSKLVPKGTSAGSLETGALVGNFGRIGVHPNGEPQVVVVLAKGLTGNTTLWITANLIIIS